MTKAVQLTLLSAIEIVAMHGLEEASRLEFAAVFPVGTSPTVRRIYVYH